ncbi:MAG: helix-turn-helix transcriptional regulator [Bacteroidota bacterium]
MRIKNLTSSQLADSIGVQRSGISHFISGRNKPSLEFILKILNQFPDINPDWLLFGRQSFYRGGKLFENTGETIRIPEKGIFTSSLEDLPDSQPSFLEELFSEQESEAEEKKTETVNSLKNQRIKQKSSSEPGFSEGNKAIKGEKILPLDEKDNENTEKIVVFYKNRTFREYFPE